MRMLPAGPGFLAQNLIRWTPADRLPMQTTEQSRGTGALLVGLAIPPGVLAASDLPRLLSRGDASGVLLFSVLLVVFTVGTLWGAHLLWRQKTIRVDAQQVRIEERTLGGSSAHATPLHAYRAIAQLDTQLHLLRYSELVLLCTDARSSVVLARVPRGSRALAELHDHFARLLAVGRGGAGRGAEPS
jgi:hypothetical protein